MQKGPQSGAFCVASRILRPRSGGGRRSSRRHRGHSDSFRPGCACDRAGGRAMGKPVENHRRLAAPSSRCARTARARAPIPTSGPRWHLPAAPAALVDTAPETPALHPARWYLAAIVVLLLGCAFSPVGALGWANRQPGSTRSFVYPRHDGRSASTASSTRKIWWSTPRLLAGDAEGPMKRAGLQALIASLKPHRYPRSWAAHDPVRARRSWRVAGGCREPASASAGDR